MSEGIDPENSNNSKKCMVCYYRAGELSKNKGKNSIFFSAIKLHVDIAVGFFPEPVVLL